MRPYDQSSLVLFVDGQLKGDPAAGYLAQLLAEAGPLRQRPDFLGRNQHLRKGVVVQDGKVAALAA
jgi:hypothetical protein